MKPKYHLGQQVVVGSANGDLIGKISTAQVVSDAWRYGVKFDEGESGTTFFYESEIKYYLSEGGWSRHGNSVQRVSI